MLIVIQLGGQLKTEKLIKNSNALHNGFPGSSAIEATSELNPPWNFKFHINYSKLLFYLS